MVPSWADQLLPQLLMEQCDTLPIKYRHIEHMHEGVWLKKIFFDKMTAMRIWTIIPLYGFCICMDSAFMSDQLLPQLMMEQFDTLPIQCRHIEHMHEVVYNFCLHRFY